jgi:hypothetical protein
VKPGLLAVPGGAAGGSIRPIIRLGHADHDVEVAVGPGVGQAVDPHYGQRVSRGAGQAGQIEGRLLLVPDPSMLELLRAAGFHFGFWILDFGFVSDFVLRIWCFCQFQDRR